MTLLIVDDIPYTANELSQRIHWAAAGIDRVLTAYSGQEALDTVRREKVDLLITDIRMPGLSGLELVARLADENPDIKMLIYSAYDDFAYAQEAIEYGVVAFLVKPTPYEEILRRVGKEAERLSCPVTETIPEAASCGRLTRDAQKYIANHLCENISLENVAQALNVHPSYLSRRFRADGLGTVVGYIIARKMERAQEMLTQRKAFVNEVAQALGYDNPNYFSRIFKRETGMSPTEFREKQ